MRYKITERREPKRLAEFYPGECFEVYDEEEDDYVPHMVIDMAGHGRFDSYRTNIVFTINFVTCEVNVWNMNEKFWPLNIEACNLADWQTELWRDSNRIG